ncbi:MAG: hypothetical protein LUH00_06290 [Lachnospiraceae bacterium]|nr:hypothetical protein [Lachnospiraceae bacterium]
MAERILSIFCPIAGVFFRNFREYYGQIIKTESNPMKKMTKWYLLLVLALVLLCVICAWYYMGVRTSRPDYAELVRAEKSGREMGQL